MFSFICIAIEHLVKSEDIPLDPISYEIIFRKVCTNEHFISNRKALFHDNEHSNDIGMNLRMFNFAKFRIAKWLRFKIWRQFFSVEYDGACDFRGLMFALLIKYILPMSSVQQKPLTIFINVMHKVAVLCYQYHERA